MTDAIDREKDSMTTSEAAELKRAEQALIESEQKYSSLFNSTPAPMSLRRISGHYVDVNEAFLNLFGYTRGEVIGRTGAQLGIYPEPRKLEEITRTTRETGLIRKHEIQLRRKDGMPLTVLFSGDLVQLHGQEYILGTMLDITDHKRAEANLIFHSHMLASLQEAICAVDENFNITFWNRNAEEIFGWTAKEAVGQPSKEIFKMLSPSNREESIASILSNNGYNGEAVYRNKNGEEIHTSVICSVIRDAQRNYKGNVATFRDITKRKQAEEALRESEKKANALVAELEAADRNKNHFLSVLSHELRNPLAAITAGLSLLDISNDNEQISRTREAVNRQVRQLCRLVDDLLDLTRINQNKIQLQMETLQLNTAILNIVEDMKLEFKEKAVHFWVKIQPQPIYVLADRVRLTQCVGNLLANALKFTGEAGAVWLTVERVEKNAVISVRDNGAGINPEFLGQLFKPFTQADLSLDRQNNNGLGLGLSIVKSLVEMHGGQVAAHSEGLGKGAEFTIRLPAAAKS